MTPEPAPEPPPGDLAPLLAMTFRLLIDRVYAVMAAEGHALRPAHGFTFQFVSSRPEPTAVELAAHLGITKQAAVQLTDDLVARGYLRRRPHSRDRRARVLELTDLGGACVRRAVQLWSEEERRWSAELGPGGLATVRAGLLAYLRISADGPVPLRPAW